MFSRRSAIAGICATAACGIPLHAASARGTSKPPRLRPGDAVGLVAPAMFSDDIAEVDKIRSTISAMGLVPVAAEHLTTRFGYLAGTDRQRADDLNAMFAEDGIRAVFAVHGGWGSARILPYLDWDLIRANPKLLIGSSDITALHLAFAARAGFPSIHGPNAAYSWRDISWNSFWRVAFSGQTPTFLNPDAVAVGATDPERWRIATIREGRASGKLLGGNLTVLASLVGTPWMPDMDGAILFLEDAGEAEYRVDRMMTQLALAGILGKVAGIVFGQCTRCTTGIPDYAGFTVPEVLRQHLEPLGVPAFSGANIGHVANQLSLPVGVRVEIDALAGSIRMLEPAVSA
ncbi:MAG: LD-carboxypeptidase [Novosphingobium sp.]|nr:LD-carboxypeptidase [Novosphingobium sp.]